MSERIRFILLGLTLSGTISLAAEPAAPAAAAEGPEAAVKSFYAAYQETSDGSGLPDASLEPRLSKRLAAFIRAARAEQEQFMKASPDEKPPFIEGDMFSSLFEGATTTGTGKVELGKDGTTAKVAMPFSFVTEGEKPVQWTDDFSLVKEEGSWRIDDVEYHGGWDFASRGKLSEALAPAR